MACAALEVTQRCNLDCTLCYLSDAAELAHDVPLPVLMRRIDMLESHYGPGLSIQITGGDPTLRRVEDLELLCREIRARKMRSCLMTNGIRANRPFLQRLAEAGLNDVAFHVDLTQERTGYATEADLNVIRTEYLERARHLGLRILFNTTVFEGNVLELPGLMRYFRDQAEHLTLVSFQLQADTGRGTLRTRASSVSQKSVIDGLSEGLDTHIDFEAVQVGHPECNRYAALLIAGGRVVSAVPDRGLTTSLFRALEETEARTDGHLHIAGTVRRLLLRRPGLMLRMLWHGLGRLWQLRAGLWKSGGKLHRLSINVHNFMDAQQLDEERCRACTFMVATEEGPLSMCVHNANRDHYLFQPAQVDVGSKREWWSASTGRTSAEPDDSVPTTLQLKKMKGRQRLLAITQRMQKIDLDKETKQ